MVRRLALVVLVGVGLGAGVAVVLSAAKTGTAPRAGKPSVTVPAAQINTFVKQQAQQHRRVGIPRRAPTVPASPGSTCYLASGSSCGRPACGVFIQSAAAALYRTEPPATQLATRQLPCGGASRSSPPKMVPIRMP